MIKLLLKIPYFRKQLIKIAFDSTYLAKEGEDAAKLKYVLTDSKGVRYYEYIRTDWLPLQRLEQMDTRIKEIESKIGRESLELFAECLEQAANQQKLTLVARLAGELTERLKLLYDPETMMRMLCGMLIREDQIGAAHIWNQRTENEKFTQLMTDNENGQLSFFFQKCNLKSILKSTNTSDSDWEQATSEPIIQNQLKEVRLFDQMLRDISSSIKPKS
jgi:hypothetical protein